MKQAFGIAWLILLFWVPFASAVNPPGGVPQPLVEPRPQVQAQVAPQVQNIPPVLAQPSQPLGAPISAALPAPQPPTPSFSTLLSVDDILKIRDPFKKPEILSTLLPNGILRTPLEMYPVDAFRLLAVATGPEHLRAMLRNPEGKTFFVGENMKIGIHEGFVKKITPQKVIVQEKIVDSEGVTKIVLNEIRMLSVFEQKVGWSDRTGNNSGARRGASNSVSSNPYPVVNPVTNPASNQVNSRNPMNSMPYPRGALNAP